MEEPPSTCENPPRRHYHLQTKREGSVCLGRKRARLAIICNLSISFNKLCNKLFMKTVTYIPFIIQLNNNSNCFKKLIIKIKSVILFFIQLILIYILIYLLKL